MAKKFNWKGLGDWLVDIGALNWGLIGLLGLNLVGYLGDTFAKIVYIAIGIFGLLNIVKRFRK